MHISMMIVRNQTEVKEHQNYPKLIPRFPFLFSLPFQRRQAGRPHARDRTRTEAGAGEAGQAVRWRQRRRHDRLPHLQVRGAQDGPDQFQQRLSSSRGRPLLSFFWSCVKIIEKNSWNKLSLKVSP